MNVLLISRHARSLRVAACLGAIALGAPSVAPAQLPDSARAVLQRSLDSIRAANRWPGASLAIALPGGSTVALVSGYSDTTRRIALRPHDRLLQGSVGKTYVAAVAMQLVREGRLRLDEKISSYLGREPWFARLPNATSITVRQLMNHTSGVVRYEFQPKFAADLRADPFREWTVAERLEYILDTAPPFAAGQGWEYSDTNYILLGLILEKLTGQPYYAELRRRILEPLRLANTIPTDSRDLPGVANGYAGPRNDLGGYDASLVNGRFAVNPGLEWTGGGIASTTEDLARWGKLLYEGAAFDSALLPTMLDGVPARLGRDARYGLGVIIRPTPLGVTYGHSGFFPGYATELLYFPDTKVALALQVNVSDPYPRGMLPFLVSTARLLTAR